MGLIRLVWAMDWVVLVYIVNGLVGALVNVLLASTSWGDLTRYRSVRALIIGAIAGYVYFLSVDDPHSRDEMLKSIIAGYLGHDVIEGLIPKVRAGVGRIRRRRS